MHADFYSSVCKCKQHLSDLAAMTAAITFMQKSVEVDIFDLLKFGSNMFPQWIFVLKLCFF